MKYNRFKRLRIWVGVIILLFAAIGFLPQNTLYANDFTQWKQHSKSGGIYQEWYNRTYYNHGSRKAGDVIGESDGSFGVHGCYVVSLSIQVARSGAAEGEFNPLIFAKKLNEHGGFVGDGLLSEPALNKAYSFIQPMAITKEGSGFKATPTDYSNSATVQNPSHQDAYNMIKVLSYNNEHGYYPVVEITLPTRKYPDGKHFIAIAGLADNGQINVNDPASKSTTLNEALKVHGNQKIVSLRFFKMGTKKFFETTNTGSIDVIKNKEEEANAIKSLWNGKDIPGLSKEINPTPPLSIPATFYLEEAQDIQTINDWKQDVTNFKNDNESTLFRTVVVGVGIVMGVASFLILLVAVFIKLKVKDAIEWVTIKNRTYYITGNEEDKYLNSQSNEYLTPTKLYIVAALMLILGVLISGGYFFAIFGWIMGVVMSFMGFFGL